MWFMEKINPEKRIRKFLTKYDGDFPFLLDMQRIYYLRGMGGLTPKMREAVLRCREKYLYYLKLGNYQKKMSEKKLKNSDESKVIRIKKDAQGNLKRVPREKATD